MAENKKSFVLYADYIESIEELTDEEAGILLKHLFRYVNDKNPECDNKIVRQTFIPIKQQLKRDLQSWEVIKEKRSQAGKASAEAKKNNNQQNKTKSTSVESVEQKPTKSTVTVNEYVTVTVNDILLEKETKDIYRSFAHLKLNYGEYSELCISYDQEQIDEVLDSIENYKKNTAYKSLFITSKNWLKKYPKKSGEIKISKNKTNQLSPTYDD